MGSYRNSTGPPDTRRPLLNSGMALGIVLLTTVVILFTIFLWVRLVKRRTRTARADNNGREDSREKAEMGVDSITLDTYPKMVYSEKLCRTKSEAQERSCCSICLNDYQESEDIVRVMPECGHVFHVECIDQWLRLHPTCPMCRTSPLPSPLISPLSTPLSEVVPLSRHDSLRNSLPV